MSNLASMTSIRRATTRFYGVYASSVFALCAVLCWPFIILLPGSRTRRRAGAAGMRVALFLAGIHLTISDQHLLPHDACIAVANHTSYLDGLVLTAVLPARFGFVIKAEAARVPIIGLVLRRMGAFFVTRNNPRKASAEMRLLLRSLRSGESLAIFPEGTFSTDSRLLPFRLGAFMMAVRARTPVVPVAITGTREILPDGCWLPRRHRIQIRVFPALAVGKAGIEDARALLNTARRSIKCGLEAMADTTPNRDQRADNKGSV